MLKISFIHLTNLWSIYHVPGAILDDGDIVVSKTKSQLSKKPMFWQ